MTEATHQPCPDCGSSDALQVNKNSTYCHSCATYTKTEGGYQPVGMVSQLIIQMEGRM